MLSKVSETVTPYLNIQLNNVLSETLKNPQNTHLLEQQIFFPFPHHCQDGHGTHRRGAYLGVTPTCSVNTYLARGQQEIARAVGN